MILIPALLILFLLFRYQRKNSGRFGITSLLLITYLITTICGVIIYYFMHYSNVFTIQFSAMVYFSISILIIFIPFLKFKNKDFKFIQIENIGIYRKIQLFFVFGSIYSILFFIPHSINAISGNIAYKRNNIQHYMIFNQSGIFNSIASLFANFFPFLILFFFISLITNKKNKLNIMALLSLLSSVSYIFYVTSYVGRDGFILWTMSFFSTYIFLKDFLNKKQRKMIVKYFAIFSIILIIPFMIITIARFDNPRSISPTQSIVFYAGMQLLQFNDIFDIDLPILYGQGSFPLFFEFFKKVGFLNNSNQTYILSDIINFSSLSGVVANTFGTFIKNFIIDFGKKGALIGLLCISILTTLTLKKVKRRKVFRLSDMFIFLLMYQIIYHGVFYFKLFGRGHNLYILIVILLYFLFKLVRSDQSQAFFRSSLP